MFDGEHMEALADVELMWHERIEQQGILQRTQELILRLLRKKFGRVPEVVVQKVQAMNDVNMLEQLFDEALMADALTEIKRLI